MKRIKLLLSVVRAALALDRNELALLLHYVQRLLAHRDEASS